jgi:hypothetical protein
MPKGKTRFFRKTRFFQKIVRHAEMERTPAAFRGLQGLKNYTAG